MNTLIKYTVAIIFCITGSLLWVDNASGAKPTGDVTVAAFDPGSALQGQDLDLTISGSGFDNGSTVRLLEEETGIDSYVEVIGEIQFIKGKGKAEKLIVPIHVLNDAPDVEYEVEVTTSGRRGKGTDLFKVEQNNSSENRNETGTTECNDGIDNDGDDFIDGEDPDCYATYDRDEPKPDNKNEPLMVTLDDVAGDNLVSDGKLDYVDGESHVNAFAGGSHPHRIHVKVTSGNRNQWRTVTVKVMCEAVPESSAGANDAIDRCDELAVTYEQISDIIDGKLTFTGTYIFAVVPYTVNCPETPTPCPNVFTMGESTKFMSFKLSRGIAPTIEAASDIGGGSVIDPGRCLSLMTNAQRSAFIANNSCTTNPANCNATITARDDDTDGENDFWRIEANGIKTLICKDGIVYGQTTLTFGYDAVKQ